MSEWVNGRVATAIGPCVEFFLMVVRTIDLIWQCFDALLQGFNTL